MIDKELNADQCKAAIVCFEVRIMFVENFKVYDKLTYTLLKMKLMQFGYDMQKKKKNEVLFDRLTPQFKENIQHYQCLQYLLSIDYAATNYETTD